jgi:aminoglycoside 6'-N-acetyltransferase
MDTGAHAIRLRPATLDDLPTLARWDEQPHVIASDPNDDWDWVHELGREVAWREQLIAELDGRPIGFVQIIDPFHEETHYWGEVPEHLRAIDIWIGLPEDLGRGYGTAMMKAALRRCFAAPEVTAVLIDPLVSNTGAIAFYQRLGFVPVERRMFGEDDTLVHRLDRAAAAL